MNRVYCKNCMYNGYYKTAFCQYEPECEYKEVGSEFSGSAKKKIRCQESINRGITFPAYKWELNRLGDCSNFQGKKIYNSKKQIKKFIAKWQGKIKKIINRLQKLIIKK